ncbi:ATP-binding protein [Neolewinella lacunae]|nr:ATP-binding protein [Neolewinella lacunae]MDN3634772.1 ATP-binding protein [Neolewinella lacunae]
MPNLTSNSDILASEFAWLDQVIQHRFTTYFQRDGGTEDPWALPPPAWKDSAAPYARFLGELAGLVRQAYPEQTEGYLQAHRLILLLALAPHLKPALLDVFFTKNTLFERGFSEFGGVTGKQHSGFLPTGETALFLLAGGDLEQRLLCTELFAESHFLHTRNVVQLTGQVAGEPYLSGTLQLSEEYLTRLTTGAIYQPRFSTHFPARCLTSKLCWKDLVLEDHLLEDLEEIITWGNHAQTLLQDWQLDRHLKPGYRTLFHGPPGTGKTLCATLIGQRTKRPVYRVDLSQVVSKYIGETEKNLANLFNQAEHKGWVLFFDEADALFGKRTATQDAHDRHANQEVSYLLQRIEDYNGLVILASNLKTNLDEAFTRRFQSMLYFPMPGVVQRLRLWEDAFGTVIPLAQDVDLRTIARDYELAGGAIVNVVRYCALAAVQRPEPIVFQRDVIFGIRREFKKDGKTL